MEPNNWTTLMLSTPNYILKMNKTTPGDFSPSYKNTQKFSTRLNFVPSWSTSRLDVRLLKNYPRAS